jgi:hypothetical protein
MMDMMETAAKLCAMRGEVTKQWFCSCGTILDCRRAVQVEVNVGPKLVWSRVFCGKCADTNFRDLDEAREDIASRLEGLGLEGPVSIETLDGRQHDWSTANVMWG